jgi:hypothetical protein
MAVKASSYGKGIVQTTNKIALLRIDYTRQDVKVVATDRERFGSESYSGRLRRGSRVRFSGDSNLNL